MPQLFEASTIGSMALANRFVRSATWEGLAGENGACTPALTALMEKLAANGIGLIISGHAYVSPEGQAGPWQLGIYADDLIPKLNQMTEAVHRQSGTIVLQLAHAGCRAAFNLTGTARLGPSGGSRKDAHRCQAMTPDDIQHTVQCFAAAAARAQQSGFDGVQIHAAHGYLLSQFLSPFYNRRTDEYGGDIVNRARIVLAVLEAVREKVGQQFPVLIKMNSEDFVDHGLQIEEMLQVAAMLEAAGIDAIELSGGTADSGKLTPVRPGKIRTAESEVYYRAAAERYKRKIGVPLILVGGVRSYSVAEQIVKSGLADYVALCRPLIREPGLIQRWQSGDTGPSTCLSDNLCFKAINAGEGVYCYTARKLNK